MGVVLCFSVSTEIPHCLIWPEFAVHFNEDHRQLCGFPTKTFSFEANFQAKNLSEDRFGWIKSLATWRPSSRCQSVSFRKALSKFVSDLSWDSLHSNAYRLDLKSLEPWILFRINSYKTWKEQQLAPLKLAGTLRKPTDLNVFAELKTLTFK